MSSSDQVPSKEMDRQEALRILGGFAMWSCPKEPDAYLRAAARAVLHDRLALIRQLEEMRVAAATAAFERAAAEPGLSKGSIVDGLERLLQSEPNIDVEILPDGTCRPAQPPRDGQG